MTSRAKRIAATERHDDKAVVRDLELAKTASDPDVLANLVSRYVSLNDAQASGIPVALAQNAALRPADAAPLRDHKVREVRLGWLRREEATPADLDLLANDRTIEVRLAVAKHSATAPETLARMCRDTARRVIEGAVSNPNTPTDALTDAYEAEVSDAKASGRRQTLGRFIADNPGISDGLVARLVADGDEATLALLAKHHPANRRVIDAVLEPGTLTRQRDAAVQELAKRSTDPDLVNDLTEHPSDEARRILATRHGLPDGVLTRLAMDNDETVARTALRNSETPDDAAGMVAMMHGPDPAAAVELTRHTFMRSRTEVVYYTLGDDPSYIILKDGGYQLMVRADRWHREPAHPQPLWQLDQRDADGLYASAGSAPRLKEAKRLLGEFLKKNPA